MLQDRCRIYGRDRGGACIAASVELDTNGTGIVEIGDGVLELVRGKSDLGPRQQDYEQLRERDAPFT